MITFPSPQSKQWSVRHESDVFGLLSRTRALDFDKEGYLKLARKPQVIFTDADDAQFQGLVAVAANEDDYSFVTTDGVFSGTITPESITITELSDSGNQPACDSGSDGLYFNGLLTVSGDTVVKTYASQTWTSRVTSLDTAYPLPMAVFVNRNELCVGNKNTVKTYNTSYSLQNTLTIPVEFVIVWLRWRDNKLYIGTRNVSGGGAMLFIWNGTGTSAQAAYGVQADWMYSGTEYRSSIAVLTSTGQLLRFNGGGFDQLAALPVYYTPFTWSDNQGNSPLGSSTTGKCTQRGMQADGDIIYLNINGSTELDALQPPGPYLTEQPSGVWVFDPAVGLYHKAGYCYSKYNQIEISSVTSSVLTMASAHGAETGDAVLARDVGSLTGLTEDQVYYAVPVAATTLSLALSPADASAGRIITIAGTPSGADLIFERYTAVGATYGTDSTRPGAIGLFTKNKPNIFHGSGLLFGGTVFDDTTTATDVLMTLGMGRNVGSATTVKIYSSDITDSEQKLFLKFRGLNLDTDKIVVKYRTKERFGLPTPVRYSASGKATWTDADVFTISPTEKDVKSVQVGDEVEIIEGAGAGYTAHVSEINTDTTPYAYFLDEAIPGIVNGDFSEVIFDNWTKLAVISTDTTTASEGFAELPLDVKGKWIQFRIELRGFGVELEECKVINTPHKQAA